MRCSKIQMGRIDPIVAPGKVSSHSHVLVGSANVGINATFDSLFQAQCTSCEIQDDKSAYWSPNLYYQFPNGSFVLVPNGGHVIYYLGRGAQKGNLVPFPKGFRMVSGDALARSYDNTTLTYGNAQNPPRPISDRVSFACLANVSLPEQPYMFRTDCVNGLRAQLHFQSCWNGVDLYKPDNSHVAYMSRMDEGVCPPTHPYAFVHLFMEVFYDVNKINQGDGGRFVWSTGDTTGYGFHGDFQNGWDPDVIREAVVGNNSCASVDGSAGSISACPVLAKSQIDSFAWQCPQRPNQLSEQVEGFLPKLPGCVNITSGPARARSIDMGCPAGVDAPYATPTQDTTPIVTKTAVPGQSYGNFGWSYMGCTNDTATNRMLSAAVISNDTGTATPTTVESCQAFCTWKGYKYAAVEFGKECYCDNYFNPSTKPNWNSTGCNYRCAGALNEACGGTSLANVYSNDNFVAPPKPSAQPSVGKYVFKGCYYEASSGRSLQNASMTSTTMSVDMCTKFCLGKKFRWAGVEYGQECYCGDKPKNTTLSAATDCKMPCPGNTAKTSQLCGGGSRLQMYFSSTL
jgi:hypothetical protein